MKNTKASNSRSRRYSSQPGVRPRGDRAVVSIGGLAAAALALSGCGFQPLYATDDHAAGGDAAPGLRNVAVSSITAPEDIELVVTRAFARRTAASEDRAEYDLLLKADEQAERLAVQTDASVTRYNYRLVGNYTLIERAGGAQYTGRVVSIASFNVVDSQYSTLYAEDSAREKAAARLVEDIERDILLKLSAARE